MRLYCLRVLVVCLYLPLYCWSVPTKPKQWQVQLDKQTISDHNDTTYVRRIMQLAKSAEIHSYMDTRVNSCDDFYEFSCGNWPKVNPATEKDNFQTDKLNMMLKSYDQLQLKLLRDIGDDEKPTDFSWKIKTFFQSCLRWENTQLYRKQLKLIISEFGVMPALSLNNTWKPEEFDWIETLAKIQKTYGIGIIFDMALYRDFVAAENITKVFIGAVKMPLETQSIYLDDESNWIRILYKKQIMLKLYSYLQLPIDKIEEITNDIVVFEQKLARGIPDVRKEKTSTDIQLRTLDYLNSTYWPTIDFLRYFNIVLGDNFNDTVYEISPQYQLNIIQVINETSTTQLANYIFYKLVNEFIPNEMDMTPAEKEKYCLHKTDTYFSKPIELLAFNNFSRKDTKHDVELMFQKLKKNFKEQLEMKQLPWMSENTIERSLAKLEALTLEINVEETKNFTEMYETLNITSINTYFENYKATLIFLSQFMLNTLHGAPNEMILPEMKVPSYLIVENTIKVPVSILQPNFFWSDHYPEALRYGTLGFLIAHELMHGFDDMGRHYNEQGNTEMWWDTNTTESFNKRRQCYQHQYRRFRYNGEYLPDSEMQTENIADNAAIRMAYNAYVEFLSEVQALTDDLDRSEILAMEQLPNLNYTNHQLFFISYAQFWCTDLSSKVKYVLTRTDSHPPAKFRVIGPLSNFDEFSKAFQCERGSTMNPVEKCKIY